MKETVFKNNWNQPNQKLEMTEDNQSWMYYKLTFPSETILKLAISIFDSNSSASFFFLASFFSSISCYFLAWRISSGKPSRSNNLSISLICFLVVAFLFFCLNVAFRWNWPRFNLFLFDSLSCTLPTLRAFFASSASFYYSC